MRRFPSADIRFAFLLAYANSLRDLLLASVPYKCAIFRGHQIRIPMLTKWFRHEAIYHILPHYIFAHLADPRVPTPRNNIPNRFPLAHSYTANYRSRRYDDRKDRITAK